MEVVVHIKFITPCLGNDRRPDRDLMLRDSSGAIIFLTSWWKAVFKFGAQALGKFYSEIALIKPDPHVLGVTSVFKRYYSKTAFKEHEAFLPDTEIEARFWLPNGLSPEDFKQILVVSGRYVGISPYGHESDYGRFSVQSVYEYKYCTNKEIRQPTSNNTTLQGVPETGPHV